MNSYDWALYRAAARAATSEDLAIALAKHEDDARAEFDARVKRHLAPFGPKPSAKTIARAVDRAMAHDFSLDVKTRDRKISILRAELESRTMIALYP